MNRTNVIRLLLCVAIAHLAYICARAQDNIIVSRNWVSTSPTNSIFRNVSVLVDGENNRYVAGHVLNTNNDHDIIVQKFDKEGLLVWEDTYGGASNGEDFASAITLDDYNNLYVTGATMVSPSVGYSIVVLKYDEFGVQDWNYVYDNGLVNSPLAGGAAVVWESGYVYVTGATFGSTTLSDYVTVKLNDSDGSEAWATRYDHAGYRDVGIKLAVGTSIIESYGALEVAPGAFRYGRVRYNKSTGALVSAVAIGDTITDIEEISDMVSYAGHTFLVGTTHSVLSGNDWFVIEFDENGAEVQRFSETSEGNANDKAMAIRIDESGNIYVAGYFTIPGEGTNIGVAKYNGSGVRQWIRTYGGEDGGDDAALRLALDTHGRLIMTGYVGNGGHRDYVTVAYDRISGRTLFHVEFDSPNGLDDTPTDVVVDGQEITVVGNSKRPDNKYEPYYVNYQLRDRIVDVAVDTAGNPLFVQNEIIVRFRPEVVNISFVDSERRFISLADLLPDSVIEAMSAKSGFNFDDDGRGNIWAGKIFIDFKTSDTVSTSRGGQTVHPEPLWSAFVIHASMSDSTLGAVTDSLNVLPSIIRYAHRNYIAEPLFVPNDTHYQGGEQRSFKNNVDEPGGIGIEAAWDIQKGRDNVRIGIYDSEMHWGHADFGGPSYANSVVRGWDFCSHQSIQEISYPEHFHGTSTGGIIGAIKNNNLGVAGIAGKDPAVPGSGAKIFSYKIMRSTAEIAVVSDIAYALHWGASSTPTYGGSLHILNNSWGVRIGQSVYVENSNQAITINQNHVALLRDAVKNAFSNECVFVAARGNAGNAQAVYPACYPDSWVISVGASGTNGNFKGPGLNGLPVPFSSSYGLDMDFIAPGTANLVYSTTTEEFYGDICTNNVSGYNCTAGTSVSAPHVSGAAALILSEQNAAYLNHPANLTGEDIEHLMQLTADLTKGPDSLGYDDRSGWGLVRMDSLMPLIDAPLYRVIHMDGLHPASRSVTLINSNVTVYLAEPFGPMQPGYYIADRYLATMVFNDDISPATYLAGWPLHARGVGLPNTNQIFAQPFFNYSSLGVGSAVTSITDHCFYLIKNAQGSGTPLNLWIPNDTGKTLTPYSIWVYDPTHYGTDIKETENVSTMNVFPVPSSDLVTVSIAGAKGDRVELGLISIDGKAILTRPMVLSEGKGELQMDVYGISPGIYFLRADFGSHVETKKIVVQ